MSSRIPSDPDDPTAPSSTVPITSTSASAPTSTSSRTGRVQPRRVDGKNDVDHHEVDQDAEDDVGPPDTGRGSDPDVARSEDEADVVDNNDVDFGHPNWSAWCGRVSVACATSIEDAVALLRSNPALMNRLAADYKRRGRDGTVKYQHLLADLGLPFPSTRFEPLRAGLTSGNNNNAAQSHATAARTPPYNDQPQQQQAPGQQRPYNNAYRGGNRSRPMTNPTTPTTSASTTAAGPASGASAAQ